MIQGKICMNKTQDKCDKKCIWTRIIISVTGVFGVFIFLLPIMTGSNINLGTVVGTAIFAVLLLYGLFKSRVDGFVGRLRSRRLGRALLAAVMVFVVLVLALAAVITAHMVAAANKKPQETSTVVVLGCAVRDGGPSITLRTRLVAAQEYLEAHPDAPCVVSGGQGSDEEISEALCMYEYLTEHGIESSRIYMEDKSTSTKENIEFSKEIIEREGLPESMTIVTNEFHEYRACRIAASQGITIGAVCGRTRWWLLPTYYVREMIAILYEWVR